MKSRCTDRQNKTSFIIEERIDYGISVSEDFLTLGVYAFYKTVIIAVVLKYILMNTSL